VRVVQPVPSETKVVAAAARNVEEGRRLRMVDAVGAGADRPPACVELSAIG
jgi:hypothetical protein